MKSFTADELVKIAVKAVELLGIEIASSEHPDGWCLNPAEVEKGCPAFDYRCEGAITLDTMRKWDVLREWVEAEFNEYMSLYIGKRGVFEDAYNTYCIEYTDNVTEREEKRKKDAEALRISEAKRAAEKMLYNAREANAAWHEKREQRKADKGVVMGDIEALAELKAAMNSTQS